MTAVPLGGFSEDEVGARRARGLGNTLPPATGRTYREILRDNAFTFVNGVVFVLGLLLVVLGQWSDALVSVGVVTINVLVGLVQEVRAKRVLDRIALLTRPHTSPERSAFFDLAGLEAVDLLIVTIVCAVWAIALRWMWRHQLLERALGIGPD